MGFVENLRNVNRHMQFLHRWKEFYVLGGLVEY